MKTYTAQQAKIRFREFIEQAQQAPVRVTRRGQLVGVMVSAKDYDDMRAFYAKRLRETMDGTADQTARAGLTPAKLAKLLADKN